MKEFSPCRSDEDVAYESPPFLKSGIKSLYASHFHCTPCLSRIDKILLLFVLMHGTTTEAFRACNTPHYVSNLQLGLGWSRERMNNCHRSARPTFLHPAKRLWPPTEGIIRQATTRLREHTRLLRLYRPLDFSAIQTFHPS